MAIEIVNNTEVTLVPKNVRYHLRLRVAPDGTRTIALELIRSQKTPEGIWLDDPRPGSDHRVPDASTVISPATFDALLATLKAVRERPGFNPSRPVLTKDPTELVAELRSVLNAEKRLDVQMGQRVTVDGKQLMLVEGSITRLLSTKAQDLAPQVQALWDTLDAEIQTAVEVNNWFAN